MTNYNIWQELEIFDFKYLLKTHQTFLLIFKIHQSVRLSVYKSGNVLQPAESAFIADSGQMLLSITLTNVITVV